MVVKGDDGTVYEVASEVSTMSTLAFKSCVSLNLGEYRGRFGHSSWNGSYIELEYNHKGKTKTAKFYIHSKTNLGSKE